MFQASLNLIYYFPDFHFPSLTIIWQHDFVLIYRIFYLHSAATWATTPAWHGPSEPTYLPSTIWRHLATRDWTSSRMQWTTWTPAVTSTRSWICITRCSVLRCALSTCHTWETRWGALNAATLLQDLTLKSFYKGSLWGETLEVFHALLNLKMLGYYTSMGVYVNKPSGKKNYNIHI